MNQFEDRIPFSILSVCDTWRLGSPVVLHFRIKCDQRRNNIASSFTIRLRDDRIGMVVPRKRAQPAP